MSVITAVQFSCFYAALKWRLACLYCLFRYIVKDYNEYEWCQLQCDALLNFYLYNEVIIGYSIWRGDMEYIFIFFL